MFIMHLYLTIYLNFKLVIASTTCKLNFREVPSIKVLQFNISDFDT